MLFYLIVIPVLLLSIHTLVYLKKGCKHDKVLFRFCDLRRELMAYMRSEQFNTHDVSKEDYAAFRKVIYTVNDTIHYFNEVKLSLDLRKVVRFILHVKKNNEHIKGMQLAKNSTILDFQRRLVIISLQATVTYTPVIYKINMVLVVLIFVLGHAASSQFNKAVDALEWLRKVIVNNRNDNFPASTC